MQTPRVLLVDDDEDYTYFVKRLLVRMGYNQPLDVVHDEPSAMSALATRQYDLVVSDFDLNPGNGVRILAHVAQSYPETRRVLLTSAPDRATREAARHDGVVHAVWDKRWETGRIQDHLWTVIQPAGVAQATVTIPPRPRVL